jgi:archaemetzincin
MPSCDHSILCVEASPHATEVGYRRPKVQERVRATRHADQNSFSNQTQISCLASFPGPLVLPGDDLASDPDYPPQSVREWLCEKDRNEVTPGKNVIYIAAPPGVQPSVDFVSTWAYPQQEAAKAAYADVQNVLEYLRAFYHGLPVRQLTSPKLSFTNWSTESAKSDTKSLSPHFIGLDTSTECIRIRTRSSADGIFKRQLNLDDLLDAAISILPDDSYALLLLLQHDLYENAEDVFTCGRAYGGSRVAVISTARYNPHMDQIQDVEREHAWPASHCKAYVETICAPQASTATRPKKRPRLQKNNSSKPTSCLSPLDPRPSALQAAVSAYNATPSTSPHPSSEALAALWLARVCRTASHELGHCFGLDHCIYYACVMQGCASLAEDARQPLYLCPIDLAKLLHATGADMNERYAALVVFCERHGEGAMFAAFAAWIRAQMRELSEETDGALL